MTLTAPAEGATRTTRVAPTDPATGRPRTGLRPSRERVFWAFLTPALALYALLFVLPSLFGLWVSFTRWAGPGSDMSWRGVANYVSLFHNEAFLRSFGNTFVLASVSGLLVFGVTFLSMMALRGLKGRAFIQSVVFLPVIVSPIAVGAAVGFLLNPDGVVNKILGVFGIAPIGFLGPDLVFGCIIGGVVWSSTGLYIALMLSAMDAIPDTLYEAADLAGANRWQKFRHITLPLSWDVFAVAAVLWVVNSLKVFEIVIAFTTGGAAGVPPIQARTVAVQQYNAVVTGGVPDLGSGAAMGIIVTVLTVILIVLVRRITRRDRVELS
ncbi:carbohydrate ABC transporter permease [Microbacterium sp. NPDC089698]|uniref:carbohydrate ABC transporter permease n=1 Tax=unclassified Microbacterium TaxID=2609290 RepID=UPI00281C7145|nr:sugar ABC transporter permease [Microbacterium sp.]MDR2322065.1 sugar ABC transporter permease [Microbacterium sp.]